MTVVQGEATTTFVGPEEDLRKVEAAARSIQGAFVRAHTVTRIGS